jgi:hypothetical protein
MRKRPGLLSVLAILGSAGLAAATPLRMEYCVEDLGGGTFEYTFTLILDNNDGSWQPGQGWRWLIFGDEPGAGSGGTGVSPIDGFIGDPTYLPIGPWTGYSTSGGGHNGPTLSSVLEYWIPTAVGETLTWGGTVGVDVPEPDMKFSTIAGTLGGGIAANFTGMHRVSCNGPTPCYADCNGDEVLNVDDFLCFINEFAQAQGLPTAQQITHYANCNGATTTPVLSVDDFLCFINEFAQGCP